MAAEPAVFMSYARFDDQLDDGQLTLLRERLSMEVRAQIGEEFAIFQDRNDIAWGQNRQQRIDEALDAVTVLLVIVTPSLFRSEACRNEVLRFRERECALGREDLILPLYYISAREIEDPEVRKGDELARVLATRQFADWRDLRFEPFTSSEVRRAIARLASQMGTSFRRPTPAPLDRSAWRHKNTLKGVTNFFTGRVKNIDQVHDAIDVALAPQQVTAVFVIHGMPGVGKSSLARCVARELVARFSSQVHQAGLRLLALEVDLHGLEGSGQKDPSDALREVLNLAEFDSKKMAADFEGLAAQWRDHLADAFLVLLLDNAYAAEQVLPLLPGAPGYVVLVTSRPPLREIQITSGAISIKLPVLDKTEASELIKKVAAREKNQREIENNEQAIQGIAELCGYLPLAMTLAVASMAEEPQVTFAARLAQLKSVPNLLFALDEYNDTTRGGVARSFELSYMQLPDERKLVLRRLGLAPVRHFSVEAAAALTNQPVTVVRAQLHRLKAEALIDEDGDGYHMHDLIRDYAKGLAAQDNLADNAAAVNRLLAYYREAAANVDSVLTRQPPPIAIEPPTPTVHHNFSERGAAITWARAELPNLLACVQYVVREADGARREEEKAWVVMLAGAMAGFLRNDGLWLQSIELQTSAITAARQLNCPLGEANALHERGQLYRLSGRLEDAEVDLERALAIYREIGGRAGETGEAHALNTLGVVLDQLKRSVEGRERLASSLAAYRRLGNHLGEANALHDQGMAEYFAKHYTEAADLLGQALALYQSVDHLLGQAHAHSNLAKAQGRAGLDPEAASHLNAARELYHQLGNRLGEATTLTELGTVLRRQSNYEQAMTEFRKAEELNTDIGNQLGLATTLKEWGELCGATGDITGAKERLTRSLALFRKYGIKRDEAGPLEVLRSLGLMDEPGLGGSGGTDA